MDKKSKAQLEKENKELKEKLRIKGGGCRFCQDCVEYRDDPQHDAWFKGCRSHMCGPRAMECDFAGLIESFHDVFLKDDACYCGHKQNSHGEK